MQLVIENKYSSLSKYNELLEKVREEFDDLSELDCRIIHACIWSGYTPISNILGIVEASTDEPYMTIYNQAVNLSKQGILEILVDNIVYIRPAFEVTFIPSKVLHVPPMICEPKEVKNNSDSAYLTLDDNKLILGNKFNKHEGDICLDVINLRNKVGFKIDHDVHKNVPAVQPEMKNCTYQEKHLARLEWEKFCEQTNELIEFIGDNDIWFTHGIDLRGRIYSKGYHLNPIGTDYRKALLNFNISETVVGEL